MPTLPDSCLTCFTVSFQNSYHCRRFSDISSFLLSTPSFHQVASSLPPSTHLKSLSSFQILSFLPSRNCFHCSGRCSSIDFCANLESFCRTDEPAWTWIQKYRSFCIHCTVVPFLPSSVLLKVFKDICIYYHQYSFHILPCTLIVGFRSAVSLFQTNNT